MKHTLKIAALAALLLAALSAAAAEELKDNQYLAKSAEFSALAKSAFDSGDYDAAAEYAREAKAWAAKSDAYVQAALARAEAEAAIAKAEARMDEAAKAGGAAAYPAEMARATEALDAARLSFSAEDFPLAKAKAEECLAALAAVRSGAPWPAVYVVRLIPERRDCLWRIAEYPFIYNDPLKWSVIYEANKKSFRDPTNPNLIFPGQKLVIPPIRGEYRSGVWDPKLVYLPFPKK